MGRKKLEIKRIESKSSRQVTFTKRRNGLIKKAKELSILCDVDVGLIIYSARGKLYSFSSSNNSLSEIVQRYHTCVETEVNEATGICETEQNPSKIGTFMTVKELLDAVERHLEDPDQLSRKDFGYLEDQLEGALQETRARKDLIVIVVALYAVWSTHSSNGLMQSHLMMAAVMNLEEKEKKLVEENRLLAEQIATAQEKMDQENAECDALANIETLQFF